MNRMRNPMTPYILDVRPITKNDLQGLREPSRRPKIKKLRDSHHNIARLAALGLTKRVIAERAGFSHERVCQLLADPSVKELVARYRDKVDESWKAEVDTFMELATRNMLKAERQISDKLDAADEAEEFLPTRELIAISRDAADRFGYGKKTTNLNVNVDFAAKLEAARNRSTKVIEGTLNES